ncbi:hypothetical protein ACFCV8_26805 [Streptomyces sp. NPDC056347]|uniref:hypothetical protein n=1 Tax=Streptomyces sp. NPDC056347 TaxID=3345790 RepID=UPI0035D62286
MGDKDKKGRLRRSSLVGAVVVVVTAEATVVGGGIKASLPWWALVGTALVVAWPAAWTGARIGRREGIRSAALAPGETVVGTYTVRPPFTEHTPPSAHEGPQYQLVVTSVGLQMWERHILLWRYGWPDLRVTADGPRLRVLHEGNEVAAPLLEPTTAAQEIRLVAARYAAG